MSPNVDVTDKCHLKILYNEICQCFEDHISVKEQFPNYPVYDVTKF